MPRNELRGKRYSPEEKANVLSHVDNHNSEHGRGGITAASKKFGITPLTISNWNKARGGVTRRSKNIAGSLRRLAELHEAIAQREEELAALQFEYGKLKRSL